MTEIVDAHVHLWDSSVPGGRDVPNFPFPGHVDGSAETLLAEMNAHNVARAIVVQSPWWQHDDRYLLAVGDRYPDRLTLVGCLPMPLASADPAAATARIGSDGMMGLRLHISEPTDVRIVESEEFRPIFKRLSDEDLPVLFVGRSANIIECYDRLAQTFPDLNIVIDHIGFVTAPFGGNKAVEDALVALSERARIRVKIAVHHQHSQEAYPWKDVIPLQQRLIAAYGASRLMWGSNWPMREPTYAQRLEVMTRHFPFKTPEDRDWIMGGTADALWPQAGVAKRKALRG